MAADIAQAQKPQTGNIEDMMTPEEFKTAGLEKLSAEELQKLNGWLQGYRETTVQKAVDVASKRAERTKLDLNISRVNGTFGGTTGKTVVTLEDGTTWKQAQSDQKVRCTTKENPAAVVIKTIFGYKMRIEGCGEFYVDPVRAR